MIHINNRLCYILSLAALCSSLSSLSIVSANMILRQVHVVSRQGAPTTTVVLDGDNNIPADALTLSAVGESQMHRLGDWLRNEYGGDGDGARTTTFEQPTGLVDTYMPTRVRLESSSFGTTIVSAQALADGLFPNSRHGIPVFSQAERNDITISAGDQCPSFQNDLDNLSMKEGSEWNQMQEAYMPFLKRLATIDLFMGYVKAGTDDTRFVPLQHIWRVYDVIREAKLTCEEGFESSNMDDCQKLPYPNAATLLSPLEWDDLKILAHFAEVQHKYGTERAGLLLGSNLLRQIANRMVDDTKTFPTDSSSKRVFVTSADYPTLVALMRALQVVSDDEQLEEAIPGYGSALVFELYQDDITSEHTVRVLYKKAGYVNALVLRLGEYCFEKDFCEMQTFVNNLDNTMLGTSGWCMDCGNDTSDLCLFYSRLNYQDALREQIVEEEILLQNVTEPENPVQTILTIAGANACPDEKSLREGFAAIFIGGIALGMIVMAVGAILFRRRQKRQEGKAKRRGSLADIDTKMIHDKAFPKTPKTVPSTPMTFFPSYWSNSPAPDSPYSHKDFDAESLSMVDNDEDLSVGRLDDDYDDVAEVIQSPTRRKLAKAHRRTLSVPTPTKLLQPTFKHRSPKHANFPSHVFPPDIV